MTLDFTDSDLAVINEALMHMPYGQVAPLIAKINVQITERRATIDMGGGRDADQSRGSRNQNSG